MAASVVTWHKCDVCYIFTDLIVPMVCVLLFYFETEGYVVKQIVSLFEIFVFFGGIDSVSETKNKMNSFCFCSIFKILNTKKITWKYKVWHVYNWLWDMHKQLVFEFLLNVTLCEHIWAHVFIEVHVCPFVFATLLSMHTIFSQWL